MKHKVISSKITYQGRAFYVSQDKVQLPDGGTTSLDIVNHSGAVTIIPVDQDGSMWFVRQYRHAAGKIMLELPAGTLDPDEDPGDCALRELQEEIDMGARKIQSLGSFFMVPGYSTEFMHIFLATDLFPSSLPEDDNEFLVVEKMPVDTAYQMARAGEIDDGKTLAALLLAEPLLRAYLE
ncbi:MAG: NUDIX hydrolase [Chloroflexota bacterium]